MCTRPGLRSHRRLGYAGKALLAGLLLVSGLGLPRSALAFRTAADLPDFAGTAKVRWATDTVEYVLNVETPAAVLYDDFAQTVYEALDAWTTPACSVLRFRSAGATSARAVRGDGLNTIQWVTAEWAGHGFPADAAAITDVQYETHPDGTWVIAEADLYLNADRFEWVPQPAASNQQSLRSVVTHEAGHIAGLLHPCEPGGAAGAPDCASNPGFAEATMYPVYSVEQATLSEDDAQGVCFLYTGSRCETEGCLPGQRCTPEGCRIDCAGVPCAEGEICADGACRVPAPPPCEGAGCTISCGADEHCQTPLRCVESQCVPGLAATGDPCASDRDCSGGVCSASGACMAVCSSDQDCATGLRCEPNAGVPTCGTDGKPIGAACDSANDCAGGHCVADLSTSPVCTRSCALPGSSCPGGWTCAAVQGNPVCAPPLEESGGCACAAAGVPWPPSSGAVPFAGAVLALVRFAFRIRSKRP
jgi:hypothetical protein